MQWSLTPIHLELKYTWAISRNSSEYKQNYLVTITDNIGNQVSGEVAPNIRYGETPEIIERFFNEFSQLVKGKRFSTLNVLNDFLDSLPLPHSLRFGIESAFVHFLCLSTGKKLTDVLGITLPTQVKTCYSIPIMEPQYIGEFLLLNNLSRFESLKIKVNKDSGLDSLQELSQHFQGNIYLDPNEAFENADELLQFLEKVRHLRISFVEQPMPSYCTSDYKYAKALSPFLLMADESVTDSTDMRSISEQFHGVNMKLMKAGGYRKGLEILTNARSAGLKTMIGCMIESSLGIASAWHLCAGVDFADLDGYMIVKNEEFNYLSEQNGTLTLAKPFIT